MDRQIDFDVKCLPLSRKRSLLAELNKTLTVFESDAEDTLQTDWQPAELI